MTKENCPITKSEYEKAKAFLKRYHSNRKMQSEFIEQRLDADMDVKIYEQYHPKKLKMVS